MDRKNCLNADKSKSEAKAAKQKDSAALAENESKKDIEVNVAGLRSDMKLKDQ